MHTQGEHDGRHGRQTLGDGSHGKAHGGHEHLHQRTSVAETNDENDATHHEAHDGQHAAQLVEAHLHGRFHLGHRLYHSGYLAHLGVGPRSHHDAASTAVGDAARGKRHVHPVAYGGIALDGLGALLHGHRLARQRSLLHLQVDGLSEAQVGRDAVARLYLHDVSRHQLARLYDAALPIAHHLTARCGHALQGIERPLRLRLLHHADDGIGHEDDQDDERVGDALAIHIARDARDGRRDEQHDNHEALELRHELLPQCRVLAFLKLVVAILPEALHCLVLGESLLGVGMQQLLHSLVGQVVVICLLHQIF